MKKEILKIVISAILFAIGLLVKFDNEAINIAFFLVSYIIIGAEIVIEAVKNIIHGELFDEAFLMTLATVGAIAIGEYPEAVAVMLFYEIGEQFQDSAVEKSRKSIESLAKIRADYANLKSGDEVTKVDPKEVKIGDVIVIKPGEKIPLDGKVLEGSSSLDTSALTGESVPRNIEVGDEVLSGCVNLNGMITVKVEKEFENSTVSKILELIENTDNKKAKSEKFITKFSKVYTPVVVILALIIAIAPPIILHQNFIEWINRAFTFLVISCPCALVISVPLSFFGGIGSASKRGVLIKGSTYLEDLAKTGIVVFDKTGTLTKGVFEVTEIEAVDESAVLEMAAYAESHSTHPIAQSIVKAYGKKIDAKLINKVEEVSGLGVIAEVGVNEIIIGNSKILDKFSIQYQKVDKAGTVIYVAANKKYCGYIVISDMIKNDAAITIERLKLNGVKQTVMLTGDTDNVASCVAEKLKLDKYYAGLLPIDKVEKMQQIAKENAGAGKLVFVGDGINDGPVLSAADIGIAMGALGSDAAVEVADIVIMNDEPSKIVEAIKISRKTLRIVKQNIVFSIGVKILVLILGALGLANMWEAVFADVGVSVIAILNALRALK